MVILIHCDMDGDGHRSGKKPGLLKWMIGRGNRPSPPGPRRRSGRELFPPTERRPLRSVPLAGPHYRVEPEILVSEFVEKEVKFLGTVDDLDCNFDTTDRASLLKIIDEQQALDFLPSHLSYENDIIVSFSVHNIKLLRRDGEKLIHRIQTHKIAAVGYVRDDNRHLVFVKFASELNPKMCNLAILCCDTKTAAEEVCSLAQQVFQLVYTDSTIDFLDKSIMDGAITPKNHSYSTDDSDKKDAITVRSGDYSRFSLHQSVDSLVPSSASQRTNGHAIIRANVSKRQSFPIPDLPPGSSSTLPQPVRHLRQHRRSGSSGSSSTNNVPPVAASTLTLTSPSSSTQRFPAHGELQIQDYLRVLKEQLTNIELKEFAQLLNQFRTGGILISEFSDKLLQLYAEERKHLLLGMRHFIPNASDLLFFNNFLKEHDVEEIPADSSPTSWWAQAPHAASRTMSETEESNTSAVGNITAVSVSSSGSDRASVSIVSNDDSGEWKSVIGNIEKLGIYPSADSPATDANGTSSKAGAALVDSAFVEEDSITQVHVPVAAAVPEGFRDLAYDTDEGENSVGRVSSFSSIKKSPIKAAELGPPKKVMKEKQKSEPELPPTHPGQDNRGTSPEQSSEQSLPGSSDPADLPKSHNESSRPQRAQKDHRKKKKHKKDHGGAERL